MASLLHVQCALQHLNWDQLYPTIYRYPYMLELEQAEPEGFQPNAPNPSANGRRWPNGGGWVARGANVAMGAFVDANAIVLSGTVGASARIEDHALVVGANVMSGTVGGLTIATGGLSVSGSVVLRVAWPYAPGWFEKPQTVAGTARILGDIELRGANTQEESGRYCGFVDARCELRRRRHDRGGAVCVAAVKASIGARPLKNFPSRRLPVNPDPSACLSRLHGSGSGWIGITARRSLSRCSRRSCCGRPC